MSSFNSQDIFGSGPHIISAPHKSLSMKRISFPGVTGEDVLMMGQEGSTIVGEGTIVGANLAALQTLRAAIETLYDGAGYTLVDGEGTSHTDCVMTEPSFGTYTMTGTEYVCTWQAQWIKKGG